MRTIESTENAAATAEDRNQFTPGPWTAREGRNDQYIIEAPGSKPGLTVQVATVYETTIMVDETERREFDARLIAASPDAHRIFKVMEDWMNAGSAGTHFDTLMPDGGDENETIGLAIRAYLNRAEGTNH
jgi:hypothetical protein